MKNIRANFSYLMHISPEVDYFRENSFLTTSILLLISAWLWVGQIVIKQSMTSLHGLLLFALVGLTDWLVYKWYREHYFRAAAVFTLVFIRAEESRTVALSVSLLFGQYRTDWTRALSTLALAAIPILILYVLLSREFIKRLTAGAVKG